MNSVSSWLPDKYEGSCSVSLIQGGSSFKWLLILWVSTKLELPCLVRLWVRAALTRGGGTRSSPTLVFATLGFFDI